MITFIRVSVPSHFCSKLHIIHYSVFNIVHGSHFYRLALRSHYHCSTNYHYIINPLLSETAVSPAPNIYAYIHNTITSSLHHKPTSLNFYPCSLHYHIPTSTSPLHHHYIINLSYIYIYITITSSTHFCEADCVSSSIMTFRGSTHQYSILYMDRIDYSHPVLLSSLQ